jgi:RHS repeat-associated protein
MSDTRYKYTGKERDVESLYDYFGARYYDSRIGRWLQVDALGEKYPALSPYAYVANNPLQSVDPDGRKILPHRNLTMSLKPKVTAAAQLALQTWWGSFLYRELHNRQDIIVIMFGAENFLSAGYARRQPQLWFTNYSLGPRKSMFTDEIEDSYEILVSQDFAIYDEKVWTLPLSEDAAEKNGIAFMIATVIHELMHVYLSEILGLPYAEHHRYMGHFVDKTGNSRFDRGTGWTMEMWLQIQKMLELQELERRKIEDAKTRAFRHAVDETAWDRMDPSKH